MKRLTMFFPLVTGCAWSTFDDLASKTPAHAIEKPDAIKATNFAVAIAGASMGTSGGLLAVLSSGSGNYATINFDAHGGTSLGDNEPLGVHTIDSVTGNALLVTDGAGQISIVDNSNVGTVVDIHGPVTGLNVDTQIPTSQKPDAATFAGGKLIVVATAMAGMPNAFSVTSAGVVMCTLNDNMAMPLSAVALAANGSTLYAWAKSGQLVSYPLASFDAAGTCTNLAGSPVGPAISPAPANGGNLSFSGTFAVLTSYDTAMTMTGSVAVVDVAGGSMVGMPLAAHGVHSALIDTFGTSSALVLGYPIRADGSTLATGAVDIHPIDSTGTISPTPSETLSVPEANANLAFGRALTTLKHNGTTILAVAADNTVFAYYKTSLYTDTRTP